MWSPLTPPPCLSLQSALSLFVNFLYFLLFLYLRPMIFHPISAFPTRNLFSLTEAAACVATLTNNVLALFIALEYTSSSSCDTDDDGGDSPRVTNLGAAFAAVNVLFIFLTLYAWDRDAKRDTSKVAPGLPESPSFDSLSLNSDLLSLSLEFANLVSTIEALQPNSPTQEKVKDELPYLHSKVLSFVRRSLHDDKPSTLAIDRYDTIVSSVNEQVRVKSETEKAPRRNRRSRERSLFTHCVGPLCSHVCG